MRPLCLALAFCACNPVDYGKPPDRDDTAEGDADTDSDTDTDTDTDGDQDHDGWTVEEGDCDDLDPYVHPGWDEDPDDGKDNDCDGRIDEEFDGIVAAFYDSDPVDPWSPDIVITDRLGRLIRTVPILDTEVFPGWLDHALDDGWVINDLASGTLSQVHEDGSVTLLAEFTEDDTEWGLYGIATHPDGYYLASTIDKLWRVDPDGSREVLASWNTDMSDPATFDLLPYTVAVDWKTGEVGLVCYYGGFATWSEADGLNIRRRPDIEAWDGVITYSGAHMDQGGWYSAKFDAKTGVQTIARYDLASDQWVDRVTWDQQWTPQVLGIDGESGDFYLTANGGWFYAIWYLGADDGYATDFYITDGTEQYRGFFGMALNL
jgi:hypothetical protein